MPHDMHRRMGQGVFVLRLEQSFHLQNLKRPCSYCGSTLTSGNIGFGFRLVSALVVMEMADGEVCDTSIG
jgi:hypothetical protein